ncbi:murein L,D-transpeptidase [Xylanimonas oleitrophica]|uniref:Murein L,D-transpeptidase n=2 Tax=Xylanimonas oleitrophica TaxID=2607479 RepID=A0A2W5WLX7_9MICO|nr:murein L,D-transpeptidase [Xylanimonas oleitrophica]
MAAGFAAGPVALGSPPPAAVPAATVTVAPVVAVAKGTPPAPGAREPAVDGTRYDLAALPVVDVFAVRPELPVDDDPGGDLTGLVAHPSGAAAPVFAEPGTAPVARLPRTLQFGGTTVPVVVQHEHWLRVLLPGRQAPPSSGDPGQLTGWVRAADVEVAPAVAQVEVDLTARTVDVVRGGERERVSDGFAWGTAATPTPVGRTFVMTTRVDRSFAFTRGHPIVYLGVQSPTLDGFSGADVAVTAFHYHDVRTGPVSNGCIRLGAEALARLAELPEGTPVTVRA